MPTILTGDPDEVILGPGALYVAPIATVDPVNVAAVTGSSAWREVGWTDAGSTIDLAYTIEAIEVEEEFYPVKWVTTSVEATVGFAMKQFTRANLALAINAGAAAVNDGTSLEPTTPGAELRVKVAHVTEEGALWIFRRCINGENVTIDRKKAPNAALLPVKFRMEKPVGSQPWMVIPTAAGLI